MLTTIPFSGFYNSIHDSLLDDALNSIFQDSAGNVNEGLAGRAWVHADFSTAREKYTAAYVAAFSKETGIAVAFESMTSPREYNFETDRIFATITEEEARRLLAAVDRSVLAAAVREQFTSRSGFMSFYSADMEEWGDIATWDHNQVGTLVALAAGKFNELAAWEDLAGDGDLENWIHEASGPEFARLARVAWYLVRREEREYTHNKGASCAK